MCWFISCHVKKASTLSIDVDLFQLIYWINCGMKWKMTWHGMAMAVKQEWTEAWVHIETNTESAQQRGR